MRIVFKPTLHTVLMFAFVIVGCGESYDKAAALRRADKATQAEQFDEATTVLREVIEHDARDVEAHFKLGKVHALQNDPYRAWVQFREVLKLDSTRVDAMEQLGMLAYAADEYAEAIVWLERTVQLGEDKPFLYDTLAYLHFQEGTIESAQRWIRKAIQANPREPRFRYKLGRYYHFVGEDKDALPLLERLAREYPTYWDAKLLLGRVYRRLGEEEKALGMLKEAVPQGKPHQDHFYELGMAKLKTGDAAGAIESFEASLVIKPAKAESRYGIGQAYLKLGEREKGKMALERFRDVEKMNKEFKDQQNAFISNWQEGLVKEREGDVAGAVQAFEAALAAKEGDIGTHLFLWMVRRDLDDPIAAARSRSTAQHLMQTEGVSFDNLVLSISRRLSKRGFNDKAVAVLNEVLEKDPGHLPIRRQLIRVYERMGKAQERDEQIAILRDYSLQ
jgi:tetratricopeptide (TPR) repeat protein